MLDNIFPEKSTIGRAITKVAKIPSHKEIGKDIKPS